MFAPCPCLYALLRTSVPSTSGPNVARGLQDLLDKAPAQVNGGCDSSDCLICQGQRQFCNQALTNSVCEWLGRRRQSTSSNPGCSSQLSTAAPQLNAATFEQLETVNRQQKLQEARQREEQQSQRKRLRLSPAGTPTSTPTCSAGNPSADLSTAVPAHSLQDSLACAATQQQLESMHMQQQSDLQGSSMQLLLPAQQDHAGAAHLSSPVLQESCSTWQWQPEFAALDGPAPAQFTEVARLQSAADASAGHCVGRCDRISGLEFSQDGQLLAAAGVSKQVRLGSQYPGVP